MEFKKAKVVVGGDSGVGKTALVHLICNRQTLLHPSYTIGCSVDIKIHLYNSDPEKEHPYFIELWDIGGSKSHENTRSIFYQNLHGLILVYDCTNKKSQLNLRKWLSDVLGKPVLKRLETDIGGVTAAADGIASTITTSNSYCGGVSSEKYGNLKANITNQMTSLLPILNTETLVSRSFTSSSESQTSNNNQHNLNYITNTVYPPILVIGTKLDLLSSHSRRSLDKFTSRFNPSTLPYVHQNELQSVGNYHPCVPMTPRSCISSVQFLENTTPLTTTSLLSSSTSWDLTYRNNYANGSVDDREPKSLMPQSLSSSTRQQSVYIDLSDSQKLSSSSSSSLLASPTKDKTWNFATEHGFSEILLNCNSVSSISPGSPQDLLLDRFFDEVINYKVFSMSMNCNLSPDLSRVKRRPVDSRNNAYKYN
uniref:Rab-like protein 3 n=1 Tax=Schistosoma mansoni TaxID=6183 RepID=A0A5K4F2X4_SCHMA